MTKSIFFFGAFFLMLIQTGCKKDVQELTPTVTADASSITTTCFKAIALISSCHGENIEFSGTIENRVSSTTDQQGNTHYTRSFNVKGLSGKGTTSGTLLPGNVPLCDRNAGDYTGSEYDVIGGAEMFAVHFTEEGTNSLPGSRIFIHQGTLVFVNKETGERVVARHVIRKTPGGGVAENQWLCGGN